ncbi:MAG TPA: M23 family metallopeptidase [Gemmatimonadaceae bacterium]|jgi:murein DD-endopeptidase MepM/ murein hydrolase activator NlpD|nr:M23 family metallopeptidase [Gemmatimonadaceae bacterium]
MVIGGGTPAWTVIVVPPTPSAAPRRLGVKMRTIRMMVMYLATAAACLVIWETGRSEAAALAAERLAEARIEIFALRDTMQTLRTASMAERIRNSPPVDMIMPVSGAPVSSRFSHSRFHPILQIFRAHEGVDLSAPAGTPIVAPAAGTVRSVGRRFGYGLTIELAHTGGVVTRYAHCRSAKVKPGQQVDAGAEIGTVGSSGLATAPHLHFEVLVKGTAVDPIKFVAATRQPAAPQPTTTPAALPAPTQTAPATHQLPF